VSYASVGKSVPWEGLKGGKKVEGSTQSVGVGTGEGIPKQWENTGRWVMAVASKKRKKGGTGMCACTTRTFPERVTTVILGGHVLIRRRMRHDNAV